jgi:hypothetical protein
MGGSDVTRVASALRRLRRSIVEQNEARRPADHGESLVEQIDALLEDLARMPAGAPGAGTGRGAVDAIGRSLYPGAWESRVDGSALEAGVVNAVRSAGLADEDAVIDAAWRTGGSAAAEGRSHGGANEPATRFGAASEGSACGEWTPRDVDSHKNPTAPRRGVTSREAKGG